MSATRRRAAHCGSCCCAAAAAAAAAVNSRFWSITLFCCLLCRRLLLYFPQLPAVCAKHVKKHPFLTTAARLNASSAALRHRSYPLCLPPSLPRPCTNQALMWS